MDETDLAMLRELTRDQVGAWGRLDPRVSASAIADTLGVARSTVSVRLDRWDETGFLVGFELWPNPGLLGAVLQAGSLRVPDPLDKPRVLETLSMMDRMAGILDHVGPWVGIGLVGQGARDLERTARVVGGIQGVDAVETGPMFQPPPCQVELAPLDWRILSAVREDPLGTDREAADRAGVSTRTLRRRYSRMIQGNALLLTLELDFTGWTGGALVRFIVHLAPGTSRSAVAKEVEAALPASIFINNSLRPEPEQPWPVVDAVAHLASVAQAADAERALLALEPVDQVEVLFPRRFLPVSHWVDHFRATTNP